MMSQSICNNYINGYGHRWCVPGKYPMQPGRLTGQAVRVLRGDGTLGELLPQLSYYDSTAGHNVSRVMRDKWDMNGYWVSYDYHYDKMGRLSTATFTCPTILGSYDYSTVYGYDLNSNLTDIKRKGVTSHVGNADYFGYIDNLYLTYNGNQLEKVKDYAPTLTYAGAMDFRDGVDAQVEYEWDSDGRMTRDGNRKIESIEYNAIDLPRRVQYKDGHIVYYTYAADGVKLKASYAFDPLNAVVDPIIGPIDGPIEGPITPINAGAPIVEPQDNPDHPVVDPGIVPETERVQSWRDYCGDYIYLNGELERILTPVGYIDSLEVHHAFVKDYRGNVRADVTEWEGVVERSDYYPYGMQMQVPWSTMWTQPYKFMGKELDRENG